VTTRHLGDRRRHPAGVRSRPDVRLACTRALQRLQRASTDRCDVTTARGWSRSAVRSAYLRGARRWGTGWKAGSCRSTLVRAVLAGALEGSGCASSAPQRGLRGSGDDHVGTPAESMRPRSPGRSAAGVVPVEAVGPLGGHDRPSGVAGAAERRCWAVATLAAPANQSGRPRRGPVLRWNGPRTPGGTQPAGAGWFRYYRRRSAGPECRSGNRNIPVTGPHPPRRALGGLAQSSSRACRPVPCRPVGSSFSASAATPSA
jgi:hypothetical protein